MLTITNKHFYFVNTIAHDLVEDVISRINKTIIPLDKIQSNERLKKWSVFESYLTFDKELNLYCHETRQLFSVTNSVVVQKPDANDQYSDDDPTTVDDDDEHLDEAGDSLHAEGANKAPYQYRIFKCIR